MSVAPQSADKLGHFGAIIIAKLKTLKYMPCIELLVDISKHNANAYNERYSDGNMEPEPVKEIMARLDVHLFENNPETQNIGLFAYNMDNTPQEFIDYVQDLEDQAQGWIDAQTHTPTPTDPTLLTNRETTLSTDLYFHIFETLDAEPGVVTTQEAGRIATELQDHFVSLLIENR